MKKKMSLIGLSNNEIKKNKMKPLLFKEMGNTKGGGMCPIPQCLCHCHVDDIVDDANLQFRETWKVNER
jgi:hypothetical protein